MRYHSADELFELNEGNFLMYAARHYESPCLSWDDFFDDLKRIKYLKRLFNRYLSGGDLKERLILNHITILYNVFGIPAATKILFYKLEDSLHPLLKTFLTYLNRMPPTVHGVRDNIIHDDELLIDAQIAKKLYTL